ncbi:MAG: hypothetical protein M3Z23_02210, partial [Acidobacteriota bacterium]|nr:hypothetical protein [Acidobacteriota bacterium]
HDFPDKKSVDASYTHNLKDLIKIAKLELARLEEANRDPIFRNHWDVVRQWSEHSRYRRSGLEVAQELMNAISDRKHGIFAWKNVIANNGFGDRIGASSGS